MDFQFAKPAPVAAATSAVRLPQPATSTAPAALASLVIRANRPAAMAPVDKRGRHRAERARYHAQCRMAMSF